MSCGAIDLVHVCQPVYEPMLMLTQVHDLIHSVPLLPFFQDHFSESTVLYPCIGCLSIMSLGACIALQIGHKRTHEPRHTVDVVALGEGHFDDCFDALDTFPWHSQSCCSGRIGRVNRGAGAGPWTAENDPGHPDEPFIHDSG